MIEIRIQAGTREAGYWRDFWRCRRLLLLFVWRDVAIRYRQTTIGIAWALIRPAVMMVLFTLLFEKWVRLPSHDVPYVILVASATIPWQFFSSALIACGSSLLWHSTMISKVYFPRLIIPTSATLVNAVDFGISTLILVALMIGYRYVPSSRILILPVFLVFLLLFTLAAGIWSAALTVKYRDFNHLIPLLIQAGLFICPIGYSPEIIPNRWLFAYSLNPMAGIIEGFRFCITGTSARLDSFGFAGSVIITLLMLLSGIWYFRNAERRFVDLI